MAQGDSPKCDPFTQLDGLIPNLSNLYAAVKAKNPNAQELLNPLILSIAEITDTKPDAALASIHLSTQSSPLKQPIYCAVIARLLAQQIALDPLREKALLRAVLTCNITFYELQVLLNRVEGKLSEEQKKKLEKHPLQSAQLMEAAGFQDPNLIRAIRQHHERPDGTGYPNRLPSEEISDLALMVSMCEVYTACIDRRIYRKPVLAREALAQFNHGDERLKKLVLSFAKAIGVYPPGTWIRLASGETALVTERRPNSPIPIVKALFNPDNQPYMGPVARDCTDPRWKVTSATFPPQRPSVDLPLLFE